SSGILSQFLTDSVHIVSDLAGAAYVYKGLWSTNQHNQIFLRTISFSVSGSTIGLSTSVFDSHCV
ncbi:TPA: hypothetical protein ACM7B3_004911, partial [Escherichia coli]